MSAKKTPQSRTTIRGKGWKKSPTVATEKFDAIRLAILSTLTTEPVRFTELTTNVADRLPDFEGSIAWYTLTCLRELEIRGEVIRHESPVLYSLAAKKSSGSRRSRKA